MASYLFKCATVVDGSGSPAFRSDVAVRDGRITTVGTGGAAGATIIDAEGLVLAPGFIDIHSHTDSTLFNYPHMESKAFQGVTLEVTGNCGLGVFPVRQSHRKEFSDFLRMHDFTLPGGDFAWSDFSSYADAVERAGIALHQAPLVGHASLRIAGLGLENRPPTEAELERMRHLLEEALSQGAWGMSTGLIYPPGSYATTEEIIALARILARSSAIYTSHIRGEGESLYDALDEAVRIGREAEVRVQISHLKAMGQSNRGGARKVLERLAKARGTGVDIAADQYPYHASATTLSAIVPQWAHEGGVASLLERLQDQELSERIMAEMAREIAQREGASGIVVSNCATRANRPLSGRTLEQVGRHWGCTPEEAAARLIVEEEGAVGAIFFSMAEEDVEEILKERGVAVGSDGNALEAGGAAGEATHPRSYGTFPRVLGHYVRERQLLSLESAVHKMTGLPAQRIGLSDRGVIRPGFAADLVLFDPATIADRADYSQPHRYAQGVVHLFVDGEPVIENGKGTGNLPGRVLRRGQVKK
ncbi:D-aminoacylase [Geomonas sp. RF6]|uniref:N-acyl-D-amino-acid deacylase family protein n=1 Tax=Geomonas sp. RF6 TaxID=2897342 RepID=UPI001E3AE2F8|nr:D-aminoacylase [Geomonas sp. RF6]UFS70746.1 D-aminoacylase [Geomonas sp. RF6]